MGYRNAADILPENLLEAIQAYIEGCIYSEGDAEEGLGRRKRLTGVLPQKKSGNQRALPCGDCSGGTVGPVRARLRDDPEYHI